MSLNRLVIHSNNYQFLSTEGPICDDDEECCFSGKPHQNLFFEQKTGVEMDTCYRNPKLSVLATMFYMVIANVIMLNILIAMFYIDMKQYKLIQRKCIHTWDTYWLRSTWTRIVLKLLHCQKHDVHINLLTLHPYQKPLLPPPFVIINPLLIVAKRIFVFIKHTTESDDSKTEVRRKKRKTNTIGLRPSKIYLLTLQEVHDDRLSNRLG